jgi:hypothetical protein
MDALEVGAPPLSAATDILFNSQQAAITPIGIHPVAKRAGKAHKALIDGQAFARKTRDAGRRGNALERHQLAPASRSV